MSKSAWYRALDSQLYLPVHPGVARLPGAPPTKIQAIAAAVLAAQPRAMASHRSAATLWDVPRPADDPIDVMFFDRTRGLELDGVVVHHPRDHLDLGPVRRQNTLVANILRWTCDLAAVDLPGLAPALDVVFTRGFASPTALMKAARVHSRQGRAGVPALRDALAEWIVDGKPADSKLEPKMRRLLSDFGLPPAQFHAWIAGHEVDFWIVDTRVVLECDGWDAHGKTRRQFERTNDRNSDLIARGYLPIPFTWHQLTKRRALIAQRIRDGLEHFG